VFTAHPLSVQHPKATKLLTVEYRAKFRDATPDKIADLVEEEIAFRLRGPETAVDRIQEEAS
jgi:uncharacterized membrane protein